MPLAIKGNNSDIQFFYLTVKISSDSPLEEYIPIWSSNSHTEDK